MPASSKVFAPTRGVARKSREGPVWVLTFFGPAIAAVATGLKDSYVVLVLPSCREEVTLNLVIALLVGGFVVLYLLPR